MFVFNFFSSTRWNNGCNWLFIIRRNLSIPLRYCGTWRGAKFLASPCAPIYQYVFIQHLLINQSGIRRETKSRRTLFAVLNGSYLRIFLSAANPLRAPLLQPPELQYPISFNNIYTYFFPLLFLCLLTFDSLFVPSLFRGHQKCSWDFNCYCYLDKTVIKLLIVINII